MQPSDRYRRNISEPDAQLALMLLVFVVVGCLACTWWLRDFTSAATNWSRQRSTFMVIAAAVVAPLRQAVHNQSIHRRNGRHS